MAHVKRIEHLPQDALRDIMTRLGGQPGGAFNVARAFAVSKTLRNFVNDRDVLCSIFFSDSLLCFVERSELFEIGGLLVRCSRAGNVSAQFTLSKVVLESASDLCCAKTEVSGSDASVNEQSTLSSRNYDLTNKLDKATWLLNYLSGQNNDPTELVYLVRIFLSIADAEDIVMMQRHLKNFAVLYIVASKKPSLKHFLDTLYNFCEKSATAFPIVIASDPLAFLIEKFNKLCTLGHDMLGNTEIDEAIYNPLLECLVDVNGNDNVECETLLERLDIVEPILQLVGQTVSIHNDLEALLVNRGILSIASMLRGYLRLLIDHEAFLLRSQKSLIESFNALFDV